jgi:hypothetical protein
MRRIVLTLETAARRFFVATGIPVPLFLRRVHKRVRTVLGDRYTRDLYKEVEELGRAVERLEGQAYLEHIGRPKE